jgi:drug/metabolite transporter (DMT)-like permease
MPREFIDNLSLAGIVLILSAGQLLFKLTAIRSPMLVSVGDLRHLLQDPLLWLALLLYGAATLLWIFVLQRIALIHAYPFAALGFVLVPVGASIFFGERLSIGVLVGSALIVTGICVTAMSSR